MAMLGQLIAGVAHELNNPVAAILRGTETLTEKIQTLVEAPHSTPNHQSIAILTSALVSKPRSTAAERELVKAVDEHIGNRRITKKLVKLGLDNQPEWIERARDQDTQLFEELEQLENYQLAGATLRSINVCAQRIADLVKSLKGYARGDDERFHTTDIHEGIEDTLVIFENKLKMHNVEKCYAELPPVRCLPTGLQQVWTNLISNAIDAFPEKGQLTITTRQASKYGKPWAVVSIEDNGHGIPENLQQQIFELNFTTKKEGNFGLGIGLSVCQQIVHQHGGHIEVASEQGKYTRMSVWLPLGHS